VFARQFWFSILDPLNLSGLIATRHSNSFAEWWRKSWRKVRKQDKKGFNSLVIHKKWILWKHRNSCVFDGSAPNLQAALQSFKDESHLWQVRGARALLPWALGVSIDGFLVRS